MLAQVGAAAGVAIERADLGGAPRYLERRRPAPLTLRQVDPLIRQLTLYRDLIDRKTGDPL